MTKKTLIGLLVLFLLSMSVACAKETAPAPAPRPAPPPPFEAQVVPEEALYLPGQVVEVKLLVKNTSAGAITMKPYPPEIMVRPLSNIDQILFSAAPGTQSVEIKPNDTITVDFSWDQKDKDGKQVPLGWYNVIFTNTDFIFTNTDFHQGDMIIGINIPARVLIQYPRGVIEKSLDLNQSQTVNGITVTLERIELTADGSTFYFFFIPPGYTPPPTSPGLPPMPPTMSVMAKAEYTVGSVTKYAGTAGFGTKGDGIKLVWGGEPGRLDPVPSDAKELIFTITQMNDWQGPWEFKIPLE